MSKPDVWVVIPAAGVGKRMQANVAKQYLNINNQTVLQHTVEQFINLAFVKGILVAVSEHDDTFTTLSFSNKNKVQHCIGGQERFETVLNTLDYFQSTIAPHEWVMVHDAARPCVTQQDIEKLYQECKNHEVGGILATPVKDTLKQSLADQTIAKTVDRDKMWHAFTPQMFRYQNLVNAIENSIMDGLLITDDASAFENLNLHPKLVEGREDNIKITRPSDLDYATWLITQRQNNV